MTFKNASIFNQINAIISILLLIIGTLGNTFCIITICFNKKLLKIPTFIFYLFMLVMDIACLYVWNLSHFLETFFGFILEDLGTKWCMGASFVQFVSLESSAWLLVKNKILFNNLHDFIIFFYR